MGDIYQKLDEAIEKLDRVESYLLDCLRRQSGRGVSRLDAAINKRVSDVMDRLDSQKWDSTAD